MVSSKNKFIIAAFATALSVGFFSINASASSTSVSSPESSRQSHKIPSSDRDLQDRKFIGGDGWAYALDWNDSKFPIL